MSPVAWRKWLVAGCWRLVADGLWLAVGRRWLLACHLLLDRGGGSQVQCAIVACALRPVARVLRLASCPASPQILPISGSDPRSAATTTPWWMERSRRPQQRGVLGGIANNKTTIFYCTKLQFSGLNVISTKCKTACEANENRSNSSRIRVKS